MKRIIAVVSAVGEKAQSAAYHYHIGANEGEVTGLQTNEAPIKVLMRLHPDIEEVIAIVTTGADKPLSHLEGKSSYAYVTHSYRSFDLISGLNEFQRYGSVDTLKSYLAAFPQPPQELKDLIAAMENVYNSLSMCRISELEDNLAELRSKLEAAKNSEVLKNSDPLLYQLLDLFEKKYPRLENTYTQLQWCLDNNLIQQALTLFNERIPKYLITDCKYITVDMADEDFLDWTDDVHTQWTCIIAPETSDYYRRPEYEQLNYLLHLSPRTGWVQGDFMGTSIDRLGRVLRDTPYRRHPKLSPDSLKPILRDFLFAQTLRNAVNHAAEETGGNKKRLDYLLSHNYPVRALYPESGEDLNLPEIKNTMKAALSRLRSLAERTGQPI